MTTEGMHIISAKASY